MSPSVYVHILVALFTGRRKDVGKIKKCYNNFLSSQPLVSEELKTKSPNRRWRAQNRHPFPADRFEPFGILN